MLDQKMFCRCKNVLEVLYHHAKFDWARTSPATEAAKNVEFLGHLLRDDLINLVKMSIRPYVRTYVNNQNQYSHKPNSGIC